MALALLALAVSDASAKPSWINTPGEFCGDNEICAVGSGNTPARAKADARAAIKKWFKSEIKSSSRFAESAHDDQFSSSASAEIWEGAKGILEGVEIKESFEDAGGYYSLAGFDKTVAAASIKLKVDQLDDKMKVLLGDDTKKSVRMLEGYYKVREELNGQYHFLSGFSIPEVVTYDQMFNNRSSKIVKGLSYQVDIDSFDDGQIAAIVKEALTSAGNKVSIDAGSSDRSITGSFKGIKQHLNVEGFVKYTFVLTLNCLENKKVISSITTTEISTSRSPQHAFESALPRLKEYVRENIYDLM